MPKTDKGLEDKIENAAEKMCQEAEKSNDSNDSEDTPESIFDLVKSLGRDGLKELIPTLNEAELRVLDAELAKAISLDKQVSKPPKNIKQNRSEELSPTRNADDEDEEMVRTESVEGASGVKHQGDNSPEGFEGQVVKSKMSVMDELIDKKGKKKKQKEPMSGDSAESSKTHKDMESAKAEGAKAQGAQIKKAGASMPMEQGKPKSAMSQPLATAPKKKEKKAKDQNPMSGNPKEGSDSSSDTKIDAAGAKVQKSEELKKSLEKEVEKNEKGKPKKVEKSVNWALPYHVQKIKAGTMGRNAHYSVGRNIIKDELERHKIEKGHKADGARWEPTEEVIEKSEKDQEKPEDVEKKPVSISDIIEKGLDKNEDDLKRAANAALKPPKFVKKSFSDADIARSLGLDVEKVEEALGEPLNENKLKEKK